eukprot:4497243-Pyramimonas_sp.AAC.1
MAFFCLKYPAGTNADSDVRQGVSQACVCKSYVRCKAPLHPRAVAAGSPEGPRPLSVGRLADHPPVLGGGVNFFPRTRQYSGAGSIS